jgi:hypothetical protein
MIRQLTGRSVLILFISLSGLLLGCAKDSGNDPDPQLDFREYKLFNYSSGSEAEAGSFRIDQLRDGNAKLTISLNEPYRQDGTAFDAVINTRDEADNELVFSYLGSVDGRSGRLVVNPVISSGSNLPVKYADLIGKSGFYVKVMNGANVQATGEIK